MQVDTSPLARLTVIIISEAMDHVVHQIFTASQSFNLLFIDLKVNSPTALKKSPIAPLLVHIKIGNMKVINSIVSS